MMKYLNKILVLLIFTVGFVSCDENENFEIQQAMERFAFETPTSGSVISLTDANPSNQALYLSWRDTGGNGASYVVDVAETGTDFAAPVTLTTTTELSFSMTVEELNTFLLDVMGVEAEKSIALDVRVTREGYTEERPTISIIIVPYTVEYTEMYLVGSFTNWNPGESLPMTNIGFNLFELTVDIPANGEFKFVPQQSGWDNDWGKDPDNEGMLIKDGEQNLSGYGPGKFKINLDFNTFTYTVEEILVTPPDNLYLVGDATAAGWSPDNFNHPMFKDPSQEGVFVYTGYFNAGSVKLLEKGDWQPQWGKGASEGQLAGNPATQPTDPDVISIPSAGYYTLTADFKTLSYTVEAYDASAATTYATIGVIGSATPTGWDSDSDMTASTFDPHIWHLGSFTFTDGAMKFRADNDWAVNWGDNGNDINVSAGFYDIWFNDLTGDYIFISAIDPATFPDNLFLVGDATAAGWDPNNNNHPMFKDPNNVGIYKYTGFFKAGSVKLLEATDWQPQWGKGAGDGLLAGNPGTQSNDPGTIDIASEGYYTLQVNFNDRTYTLEAYDASAAATYSTIGVIGSATPTGWDSDTDMTQSSFDPHIWYISNFTITDGAMKFRAEDGWDVNWGDNGNDINVSAGTYNMWLNDLTGEYNLILN